MNFQPNQLALLISLICAGASTNAFGKAENAADREGDSQKAADWLSDAATLTPWPMIWDDDLTADAANMGQTLPTAAAHDFHLTWRVAEASEPAETGPRVPVASPAHADPLEVANNAAQAIALPAASLAVSPTALETPPHVEPIITPSAQRVMRSLAAIRLPVLDVADAVVERAALVALQVQVQVPAHAPPLDVTPAAKVLATLNEVLAATPSAASTHSNESDTAEGISLEAAIAARQELKRLKQRARAEAAEMAKATRPNPLGSNPFGSDRVAVVEAALDRVRGGFVTPSLNISFGIERAVYINGALVTTTSLNISDLGRVTNTTNSTDSKALTPGSLALIQSGAGNSVAGGAFSNASGVGLNANAIGTVVQNTLDGQKIQNVTVINATANSVGVLRDLNLQNTLRNSLIDSLRR